MLYRGSSPVLVFLCEELPTFWEDVTQQVGQKFPGNESGV